MRSTAISYVSWNLSSGEGNRGTMSEFSRSSTCSDDSSVRKSASARNIVVIAARTVAEAISTCFTPPETTSSNDDRDFHQFRASSVAGGDGKRSSSRGIFFRSYNADDKTVPGGVNFTMAEIYKATRDFSPSLKIGQGGFGTVYKGRLDDGTLVALKRAKKSLYDKHLSVEFHNEIQTLARVDHLNLVRFFGCLEHGDERIVVVEYVPNGTLRELLDGLNGKFLDFAARLEIAIDVAHAVTYLHMYADHPIIHRDIKSSNILLTENFRAKVADFGFARFAADSDNTHVSTQVKGTAGYLDPEYLRTYQLTDKSDVYSFGVVLVELVTGRRPIEPKREFKERITTRWAMNKFTEGDGIMTLDPMVERNAATNLALEKILELASQCLAPTRESRPSMKRCGEILWGIRKDYRELCASEYSRSISFRSQRSSFRKEY
ncbi:calmodulin-binding receptor-like cytoplasmic kinase 2 [Macadamia integrifolia]|uniref:calmodulin-binding receptor-like cytoplasmic kinase 2 n=1 Tax=Macadamia integrifolia TaxID=60698 RepID=UPI001C52D6FC|nr:calmodulin-binding receptor-like cytoplasmic kinase 2 [Macadamia integrifolia]